MTEENIRQALMKNITLMAKALAKGNDLEIRKSASGVTVAEVKKKVIAR